MTLFKHYRNAAIYPSLVVIVLTIFYSFFDNYDYKSEWFTAESVVFMTIGVALIYSLIISGLSLTIFLNKLNIVKVNKILTALTWFFLPFSFIAVVSIQNIRHLLEFGSESTNDIIYLIILNIPFVIGLVWSYLRYRKLTTANRRLATSGRFSSS